MILTNLTTIFNVIKLGKYVIFKSFEVCKWLEVSAYNNIILCSICKIMS